MKRENQEALQLRKAGKPEEALGISAGTGNPRASCCGSSSLLTGYLGGAIASHVRLLLSR